MEANEFVAKTVEEAVEEGLKSLGLSREQADVEVLEEPTKGGLFGIGSKKAKVRITAKASGGERAAAFVEGLFELLSIPATSTLEEKDGAVVINVITTASSSVIGYRGEVLDAVQTLAGAVANTGKTEYSRVVVDCEGYRSKREETLRNLAAKLADKAVRTGRKVTLEPMTPFERRVIHSALADNTEVKTVSEGKEPSRYISIIPNNMRNSRPIREGRDRNDHGYDRRDRGNDRGRRDGRYDRRDRSSGGSSYGSKSAVKRSGFGGTYLGNSLKDNKDEQ